MFRRRITWLFVVPTKLQQQQQSLYIRQPDIAEFCLSHKSEIRAMRRQLTRKEKTEWDYLKDAANFLREMRSGPSSKKTEQTSSTQPDGMSQYYESQELLKRVRWKRITWDKSADYSGFSRRVLDNELLFKAYQAFSFLEVHLINAADGSTDTSQQQQLQPQQQQQENKPETVKEESEEKKLPLLRDVRDIKPGSLSCLFLNPRRPVPLLPKPFFLPLYTKPPFQVNWITGTAELSDRITVGELASFLETVAPRLQEVQRKHSEELELQPERVEELRNRIRARSIRFNDERNVSRWDDPLFTRKHEFSPSYVTPADLNQFILAVSRRASLFRRFLRGCHIRILPPSSPYRFNPSEGELGIPCNFEDYNWMRLHRRYETRERLLGTPFRAVMPVWFILGIMLLGDLDIV